jgi:hypothetical protein
MEAHAMPVDVTVPVADFKTYKQACDLIKRTNTESPKPEDMAALRKMLDEHPAIWQAAGRMAQRAATVIVGEYFSGSGFMRESVTREIEELRAELDYEVAPPLEKLLIEQVIVCRLNLYALETNTAVKLTASHTTEAGLYWDRRLAGAHRRFTRACEALAKVRKLSAEAQRAQRTATAANVRTLRALTG